VAHGGDWSYSGSPYLSNAALSAAYANGADGVKIDVRVTKDNVPVIAHSSPIELFESLDCANDKIEEMTAAEVTACHRVPSATETFQRLDDVLDMLRGKLVIQLCVKEKKDYARTIAAVLAKKAEDFAFIETDAADMPSLIPSLPDAGAVDYLVNVASSLADVDVVLALKNPRVIMIEIDPTVALGGLAASKLHPAGVRAFTYDDAKLANAGGLAAHYAAGHDVVSSNFLAANVQARVQTNQARGVTPP
jgi:glycerophosphoryl diester phosphodiesterase